MSRIKLGIWWMLFVAIAATGSVKGGNPPVNDNPNRTMLFIGNGWGYSDSLFTPNFTMEVDTPPPSPYLGPGDPTTWNEDQPFSLPKPGNVEVIFELDESGEGYIVREQVGGIDVRPPSYITMEEYIEWRRNNSVQDYFRDRGRASNELGPGGIAPSVPLPPGLKSIFGDGPVEIRPNGTALIDFAGEINRMENPSLPVRQQRTANFRFDQQIQLSVVGKIGDKLRLNANWDTQATFDFENQLKLEYTGHEDEILQKIEAGNVSLPLTSSLIRGGQNLFGIKVGMRFGPVNITTIASQQKGKTQSVTATGGAQQTEFSKKGNEYDEYRHYFLSHYFRSRYEYALANLPNINSGITITRMEVWVTNNNSSSTTNNRNAVGFIDLGENDSPPSSATADQHGRLFNSIWAGTGTTRYPDNDANDLYSTISADGVYSEKSTVDTALINLLGLENGIDFQKVENMRKLNDNEFRFHPKLGYISLNTQLQANQVLFVSYEYMLNGEVYQVGDFSLDPGKQANDLNSNVLFLKMLKPSSVRPEYNGDPYPAWDLMMKNIYSIGGYGLRADNFRLNIKYQSGTSAGTISTLPSGAVKDVPLLQVFEMDNLTNNDENRSDNIFDFKENITIIPDRGLIIFPVLEPFGSHLADKLNNVTEEVDKYVFQELYELTRQDAINYYTERDRFLLEGSYQSASSAEISLNSINVAPGSVVVTANGITLTEGSDYQVDYNIGKVTILNQGILTSGQEIQVTFETNTLFGIETKTLLGARVDFNAGRDFILGGTILHLNEQPLTAKMNIGDEPISNMIWGLDGNIRKESRFLTRLIDKLPLIQTKEKSQLAASAEIAQLRPGHPKIIQVAGQEDGIAFLDDFESAKTIFDLAGYRSWTLASYPGDNGNNNMVDPAPGWNAALSSGFSRAKLSWYSIDPSFFISGGIGGGGNEVFPSDDLSNHYSRLVSPLEVFPNQTLPSGLNNQMRTFDLHFQPDKRGPYNYETEPALIDSAGNFRNPEDMWGGIMRRTSGNTDFEAANFEFIEFWLMDPFIYNDQNSGELYLDLGQISEDIGRDNVRAFENALPTDPNDPDQLSIIDTTEWGRVPVTTPPTTSFNNDKEARQYQDVGLDGLWDDVERDFFSTFLDEILNNFGSGSPIYQDLNADPSSDNYQYFRGEQWDNIGILERYDDFNNHEGNTPVDATENGYSTQGTPEPDTEDINRNGTLNTNEEYWEYQLKLKPSEMIAGRNFIVDVIPATVELENGDVENINWYQFRIPLTAGTPINNIQNFKAIEFIRMYMKDWKDESVLRFAKFQLVSTTWRTYRDYLGPATDTTIIDPGLQTSFEIGTVNIEENGSRLPFNYMLPPNVVRQNQVTALQQGLLQNEQSMVMKVCNLADGDARGAFKLTNFDLRSYKKLKMWVHAENVDGSGQDFQPGELRAFIRLGQDHTQNYYEYEIPLTASTPGIQDSLNIWLADNQFDFELSMLNAAKAQRTENNFPVSNRYAFNVPGSLDRIYVVGSPRLSEIKTIMVGIRNESDNQGPICAEVWVNELRVTDFNEQPGEAANARINIRGADFFDITASGSYRSPGFGSLEQKINSRSRETVMQYDVAGNFQLGKFFPKKWGIQLPLYMTYGERLIDPQYNPLESDVLMSDYLDIVNAENPGTADSVLKSLQDYTRNRSISLNNVRKIRVTDGPPGGGRGGGTRATVKTFPWAIENFSLSLSYNENYHRNHTLREHLMTNHRAALSYAYTFNGKPIEPFKGAKKKNIITAFNFYPLPKQVSITIAGDRRYEKNEILPTSNGEVIDPTFFKNFLVTRTYNLRWDFTKSLSFTYAATNLSRVDEPYGDPEAAGYNSDSLWSNLFSIGRQVNEDTLRDSLGFYVPGKDKYVNIGRNTSFNQSMGLNYIVPLDKFQMTNWISSTLSYQAGFRWQTAPDNSRSLGNTISNTQNINATARLNLQMLYQKVGFLKRLMDSYKPGGGNKPGSKPGEKPNADGPGGGEKEEGGDKEEEEEDDGDSFVFLKLIGRELARTLLSVRSIDVTYGQTNGTTLPGYMPVTDNFGMDFHYRDPFGTQRGLPPGWDFIAGFQEDPHTLMPYMADNRWLSTDPALANVFEQSHSEQLTGRTSFTIFGDFRIDLNMTRNRSESFTGIFRDSVGIGDAADYSFGNELRTGNFSMSYIFANSAFEANIAESKSYVELNDNARREISRRLAEQYGAGAHVGLFGSDAIVQEYYNGYYANNQDVLIPAFLSAYGLPKSSKIYLNPADPFPKIPLPNWNINYSGLNKVPAIREKFNSITLRHAYRGNFSIGSYTTNVKYDEDMSLTDTLFVGVVDSHSVYNFRNKYVIQSVSMTEAFSPLMGININFKNGITASIDYKTTRNITLSVGNLQLTETRSKDITVSLGWRKDRMNASLRLFGRDVELKNSLNSRLEVSIRDSKTRNRMLDSKVNPDFTGGNFMLIIKPSVDYVVNTRLNLRFYVEHSRNRPAISTSFPSSYTAIGFQVRFTLAN